MVRGYKGLGIGRRSVPLHRVRAEQALGRPLPAGAEVHHVNGDKWNPHARLVICQDGNYHKLLHVRACIVRAGGNPDTDRVCRVCKTVKPLTSEHFGIARQKHNGRALECRPCVNASRVRYRLAKRKLASAQSTIHNHSIQPGACQARDD
jgi:hypothetical protein